MAAWTCTALGEEPPARPPLSFQASIEPLTASPRSWLYPAVGVQRSALPVTITVPAAGALYVRARCCGSTLIQDEPLLLESADWPVKAVLAMLAAVGTSCSVSLVGENRPPMGPAPAKMVAAGEGLFVFHCSFTVYTVPLVTG